MPQPGRPNNPRGFNGVDDPVGGATSARGQIQRSVGLTGALPTPGGDAPRRAQRQATRPGAAAPAAAPAVAPQPEPTPLPPQVLLAQRAAQIAAIPGASFQVRQLAEEAQSGAAA